MKILVQEYSQDVQTAKEDNPSGAVASSAAAVASTGTRGPQI